MRSVIPDAVGKVLATQRTILFGECPQFRPLPQSGANLPIGDHSQNCAQNRSNGKIRPIDCHFTFLEALTKLFVRMYAYSPSPVPYHFPGESSTENMGKPPSAILPLSGD